jgi:hypothetical protein
MSIASLYRTFAQMAIKQMNLAPGDALELYSGRRDDLSARPATAAVRTEASGSDDQIGYELCLATGRWRPLITNTQALLRY